jgi:hypothetical protein
VETQAFFMLLPMLVLSPTFYCLADDKKLLVTTPTTAKNKKSRPHQAASLFQISR